MVEIWISGLMHENLENTDKSGQLPITDIPNLYSLRQWTVEANGLKLSVKTYKSSIRAGNLKQRPI